MRMNIDLAKGLTKEQEEMIRQAKEMPVIYDEDCPPLSEQELREFKRADWIRGGNEIQQTVILHLSPQALHKAVLLGADSPSVLSRLLERALNDKGMVEDCL